MGAFEDFHLKDLNNQICLLPTFCWWLCENYVRGDQTQAERLVKRLSNWFRKDHLKSSWIEALQLWTYRRSHLQTGRRGRDTKGLIPHSLVTIKIQEGYLRCGGCPWRVSKWSQLLTGLQGPGFQCQGEKYRELLVVIVSGDCDWGAKESLQL